MLVSERQQDILQRLNSNGSVYVEELCSLYNVSSQTIRRDLADLALSYPISRTRGGATILNSQPEIPHFMRSIENAEAKKQIAQKALTYIESGDQVILDSSSSVFALAELLPNMPLTVITNSVYITTLLSTKDKITVICAGGILLSSSMCFVGRMTEAQLQNYAVQKAFISSMGLTAEWGLSELNERAVMVKRAMLSIANETFALIDSSKLGIRNLIQVSPLEKIDHIITEKALSKEQLLHFKNYENRFEIT